MEACCLVIFISLQSTRWKCAIHLFVFWLKCDDCSEHVTWRHAVFQLSSECNLLIFIVVRNVGYRNFTENATFYAEFTFCHSSYGFQKKIEQRWISAPDLLCCTYISKLLLVVWTLKFWQQCFFGVCRSCGIWHCVTGWVVVDYWRWGQYIAWKHQEPVMQWHSITSQKAELLF